jgi:hypothetical protein
MGFYDKLDLLIPLVALSDFEKLDYDHELKIVRSLPKRMRDEFDERKRLLLGIYEIAGDDDTSMYFLHSWNNKSKACSAAFLVDFTHCKEVPKKMRTWAVLNPSIPVVSLMLGMCSEMAHEAEGEHEYGN